MTYPIQGQEVVPASPATGAGQFNPYRGMDVHGVASPDQWQDVQAPDTATAIVPTHEEPPEPEPIPVRVMQESAQEMVVIRTRWEYVDQTHAVRVAGRDLRRKKLRIRTGFAGAGKIWVLSSESMAKQSGYAVEEGVEFSTEAQNDVWVIHDFSASLVVITVAEEIAVGI